MLAETIRAQFIQTSALTTLGTATAHNHQAARLRYVTLPLRLDVSGDHGTHGMKRRKRCAVGDCWHRNSDHAMRAIRLDTRRCLRARIST